MPNYKQFISAVVYVRNNQDTISDFLLRLNKVLLENFYKYEIICVNDNSEDSTCEQIEKVSRDDISAPVTVVNFSTNNGQEKALTAGIDLSIGDFVYEFESCNIDYNIEEVMNVYSKALTGYDIVAASSSKKPNIMSILFYKLLKTNNNLADVSSETFRVLSRRAINRINSISDSIVYRKAIYHNCGLKTITIKYEPDKNIKMSTKSFLYKQNLAIETLLTYSDIGYRISLLLSITMVLFSVAVAFYTVIMLIFNPSVVAGWTTMMLFLSLSFFAVFILLTILIKYVSLILSQVNRKKNFVYESVNKVNKG